MRIVEPARNRAMAIASDASEKQVQRVVEQEAVKESLANLMTFPWVAEHVNAGKTRLHGWYFDLEAGLLHIMDSTGAFHPVED
jgi:carbonic anhydrase